MPERIIYPDKICEECTHWGIERCSRCTNMDILRVLKTAKSYETRDRNGDKTIYELYREDR